MWMNSLCLLAYQNVFQSILKLVKKGSKMSKKNNLKYIICIPVTAPATKLEFLTVISSGRYHLIIFSNYVAFLLL